MLQSATDPVTSTPITSVCVRPSSADKVNLVTILKKLICEVIYNFEQDQSDDLFDDLPLEDLGEPQSIDVSFKVFLISSKGGNWR